MLTTIKFYPFLTLLTLSLLLVLGCTSPSNQEIKSSIPVPSTCIEPLQFKEITVGSKQAIQASEFSGTTARAEWYPVRVKFSAKCLPEIEDQEIPFESVFGNEEDKARIQDERKAIIEKEGVMKSFTKHYNFRKNVYDEWIAYER